MRVLPELGRCTDQGAVGRGGRRAGLGLKHRVADLDVSVIQGSECQPGYEVINRPPNAGAGLTRGRGLCRLESRG